MFKCFRKILEYFHLLILLLVQSVLFLYFETGIFSDNSVCLSKVFKSREILLPRKRNLIFSQASLKERVPGLMEQ